MGGNLKNYLILIFSKKLEKIDNKFVKFEIENFEHLHCTVKLEVENFEHLCL